MNGLALPARTLPRRLVAAVVALAYAMPLMLAAVSDAGHGAFHLFEGAAERQAAAAALGVAHLADEGAYTHTHGGTTHSHAGVVDALLFAADDAADDADGGGPVAPMVRLSAHAPATVVKVVVGLVVTRVVLTVDAIASFHPRALPPVPPPRA